MKQVRPVVLFTVFATLLFSLAVSTSWSADTTTPCEKLLPRLEKRITELEQATALYMESLATCTEENQELEARLKTFQGNPELSPEKRDLIQRISIMLGSEQNLQFLGILKESDLKLLIQIISEKLNSD